DQRRLEAAAVVEPEVAAVVVVLGDDHPLLAQHLAEQREVDRLVVDEHAVEVEDHRPDHAVVLAVPARARAKPQRPETPAGRPRAGGRERPPTRRPAERWGPS